MRLWTMAGTALGLGAFLLLPACEAETDDTTSSSSDAATTGTAASSGASTSSGMACMGLPMGDAPDPTNVRIRNQSGATVYLDTNCGGFVRINGASIDRAHCADYAEGEYCGALDCAPESPTALADGASEQVIWDGLIAGTTVDLEPACQPLNTCGDVSDVTSCEPGVLAPAGDHTLELTYLLVDDGTGSQTGTATATVTLPANTITITINP